MTNLSEPMTDELKEIDRLYQASTQGEWHSNMDSNAVTCGLAWIARLWSKQEADFDNHFNNREFIAAIHNAWPRLLKLVGELQAELVTERAKHNAWTTVFETTQLTHAKSRLETAESKVERLTAELSKAKAEIERTKDVLREVYLDACAFERRPSDRLVIKLWEKLSPAPNQGEK